MPSITLPTALQTAVMRTYTDTAGWHSQTVVPVEMLSIVTGTLAALSATVNADITDAASISVVITGTLSMTIAFEASIDGTTWVALNLVNSATMALGSNTGAIVAGGIGFYGSVAGWRKFRVRASAFVSGSAAVTISPACSSAVQSMAVTMPQVTQATPFPIRQDPNDLGVTATSTAGAAVTLTLPAPGAGLYQHIDVIELSLYSTAARTGVATPITVTSTNLPGLPSWLFPSTGVIGDLQRYAINSTCRTKALVANTATTIVCPAVVGGLWKVTATYTVDI